MGFLGFSSVFQGFGYLFGDEKALPRSRPSILKRLKRDVHGRGTVGVLTHF